MVRTATHVARRARKNRVMKRAKGFVGSRHRLWRIAKNAVMRAERYAFIGRKRKKRDFRQLWIVRINAAARQEGIGYSRLICGLRKAGIDLNRKMMAELAMRRPEVFRQLVAEAKSALG